jgi:PAS domain S-box-containing protein
MTTVVSARVTHVDTPVSPKDIAPRSAEDSRPPGAVDGDRASILLVDDSPANLLTFETILADLNEPIVTARSGEEALRKLLSDDFAVIVMDVNMPGMTGFEAASLIRQRKRTQHTPIIFVSAISVDEVHAYRGYSIGGVDYIFAPIVPEVLRTKVRVFVDLYKQRREVQRQAELLRGLQEREHRRALSETSEKLRAALDAGRMGVWELDLRTERIAWTPIPGGIAGIDPATAWNSLERFGAAMPPEVWQETRATIQRCRAEGADLHIEPRLAISPDRATWIEIRARLLSDETDSRERFVGVFIDVTDRKQAEQDLRRARDAANEANQAKDRFLATLSHELRTPLTPALMAARGWLTRDGVSPELRRDLKLIGSSIETESRLIDDLLDLTNIARDSMTVNRRPVDFHQIVTLALQSVRDPAQSPQPLTLDVQLAAGNANLSGDPVRLQQVVWNLVSNAYKFSPDGGTISIRTFNSPGTVVLEVQDTGIGIDSAFLERIFDAFEKAPTRDRRNYGGLGLGLAICQQIVTLHEGTIRAESPGPGRGTTLRVTLPLTAAESHAPCDACSTPVSTTGLRILIVEDHPSTAEVMSRLLTLNGHKVKAAATVEAGLELAFSSPFDLLISDLGLPDGTGIDLLRRLRETHDVPAIALTGYGRKEDVEAATSAGFAAHLTKPVDLDSLQATISRVVTKTTLT